MKAHLFLHAFPLSVDALRNRAFHAHQNSPGDTKLGLVGPDGYAYSKEDVAACIQDTTSGLPAVLFWRMDEYKVPPALLRARLADAVHTETKRRAAAEVPPLTAAEFKLLRLDVKSALAKAVQPTVRSAQTTLVPVAMLRKLEVLPLETLAAIEAVGEGIRVSYPVYLCVTVGASDSLHDEIRVAIKSIFEVPKSFGELPEVEIPDMNLAELVLGGLTGEPSAFYGNVDSCSLALNEEITTTDSDGVLRALAEDKSLSGLSVHKLRWRYSASVIDFKTMGEGDVVVAGVGAVDGVPGELIAAYGSDGFYQTDADVETLTVLKPVAQAFFAAEEVLLALREMHEFLAQVRPSFEELVDGTDYAHWVE